MSGGADFIMHVPKDQADTAADRAATCRWSAARRCASPSCSSNSQDATPAPQLQGHPRAQGHHRTRSTARRSSRTSSAPASRVLHTICFPSQFGCTDEGATRYKYDPALAKKLLAEAGFPNGFEIEIVRLPRAQPDRGDRSATCAAVGIKAKLQLPAVRGHARHGARQQGALTHQTWGSFSVNDVSASTPVYFGFERRRRHARPAKCATC